MADETEPERQGDDELMPPSFDDRIAAYINWFYQRRTDDVGRYCVGITHDRYCRYILSGDPQIRYEAWKLVHATCRYLQQQGVLNDGLN